MALRCAILDDYQNVALTMADWSKVKGDVAIKVFNEHLGSADKVGMNGVNSPRTKRKVSPAAGVQRLCVICVAPVPNIAATAANHQDDPSARAQARQTGQGAMASSAARAATAPTMSQIDATAAKDSAVAVCRYSR